MKGESDMAKAIYTKDIAVSVIDAFEDLLDKHGIKIPSSDDDDRDYGTSAPIYGTEYGDLSNEIENIIACYLEGKGIEIIPDTFDPCRQ